MTEIRKAKTEYSDGFELKLISSMEKIINAKEPTGEGAEEQLTLLQGETISFQIAYCWTNMRKERAAVRVEAPEGLDVHVRTTELVPCEYPAHMKRDDDYLVTEPGAYPDLLSEVRDCGISLIPGQWKSLWVDLKSTEQTAGGKYTFKISFSVHDELQAEVEQTAEVIPVELPKLPIPHTEWFHSDCLANYYDTEVFSEKHWEIIENFIRTAVERNINMILTPIFTPPLDTAIGGERRTVQLVEVTVKEDGAYEFGYDLFERWVKMCLDCGVEYFEISHLFSQWGAKMAPKIMGWKNGEYVQLFGWDTDAAGKIYGDFLHQFLTSFKAELDRLEIGSRCYFHLSDEPGEKDLQSYEAARNQVAEDLEGYALMDALSDYSFYEKGLVAQPVCAVNHIGPFLEHKVENLWAYYCTAQYEKVTNRFISMPGYRTRILGAMLYKYDLKGFLHWGYNFYNSEYSMYALDPYRCTDAGGSFPSGDAFLVYPGEGGQPEESIRLMMMDEAMNDLRAMHLLEKLAGREAVMECLEPQGGEAVTFDEYPRSISYMTKMRADINEKIRQSVEKQ
ncbi:MAG: DUF4091 domain-containing protein [Eubacteriales bacterium]|nr:DUF4091 domain-containing protein [Eubacteriales bacterium]